MELKGSCYTLVHFAVPVPGTAENKTTRVQHYTTYKIYKEYKIYISTMEISDECTHHILFNINNSLSVHLWVINWV